MPIKVRVPRTPPRHLDSTPREVSRYTPSRHRFLFSAKQPSLTNARLAPGKPVSIVTQALTSTTFSEENHFLRTFAAPVKPNWQNPGHEALSSGNGPALRECSGSRSGAKSGAAGCRKGPQEKNPEIANFVSCDDLRTNATSCDELQTVGMGDRRPRIGV